MAATKYQQGDSMSTAEQEHYIEKASSVKNLANKRGKLIQSATRYLRYNERQKRETEKRRIQETVAPANMRMTNLGELSRQQALSHLSTLEDDLEQNSPPTDLSGNTRDAIYAESKRLEGEIAVGMLSKEEMRRNPVNAVDRHIQWERANKDKILKWKNFQILLEPESDAQDLANIEKIRPSTLLPNGTSTYMGGAQIPGVFAMTPQAKENWPKEMNEYAENSPLMVAMRRELEESKQQIEELKSMITKAAEPKVKARKPSEARALRMKEYWAKRKATKEPESESE
jgi:hypothetical protein